MPVLERFRQRGKRAEEEVAPSRKLFIGVYRHTSGSTAYFDSFVGREEDFTPRIESAPFETKSIHPHYPSELVKMHPVPPHLQADMQALMSASSERYVFNIPIVFVGFILVGISRYRADGIRLAETMEYQPKQEFENELLFSSEGSGRNAPGLGYITEWLTISSLRGQVTQVKNFDVSSDSRKGQLERAGLPVNEAVPIEEWLKGMQRGYEKSLRRASLVGTSTE